jgi:DNA-binding NarL/FixJ family response regulator
MVRRREKETAQPASGRLAQFRVAVAAPTQLEQAALQALLATFPGIVVVAIDAVPPPHVLFWVAAAVTSSPPAHGEQTAVLALVTDLPAPTGVDLAGMFARDEKPEALGAAIRQVARGQEYLSPSLALALLQRQHGLPETPATARLEELTEREREIFLLLGEGLSNKAIAARLYLSVRTVEGHLANTYAKLGVRARTEAALFASRLL